eukprot:CAMPEP_0170190926 /NCGR_PEP_ID=MMETSP0040_2-20121228/50469_1 /TAXON_ID=641309 /ORGANISM="Lotharella oceanica, Strain CCMP622" /LENGTH=94 /DNA_ID=CAMNT_0010438893 /DNA_START=56 /DNA_END=340 /DNA_ORIENTATION=-
MAVQPQHVDCHHRCRIFEVRVLGRHHQEVIEGGRGADVGQGMRRPRLADVGGRLEGFRVLEHGSQVVQLGFVLLQPKISLPLVSVNHLGEGQRH